MYVYTGIVLGETFPFVAGLICFVPGVIWFLVECDKRDTENKRRIICDDICTPYKVNVCDIEHKFVICQNDLDKINRFYLDNKKIP
jgi:hypothetical protein